MDKNIYSGRFGLERETLRVTKEGKLAQTKHPFYDDSLSRDFCENQLEIITPVCDSIEEAVYSLRDLSDVASEMLKEQDEFLWMCSNPPHIDSEDEIPIAQYKGKQAEKHEYRKKLEQRYGKKMMTYSGIHFNMSFDEDIVGEDANHFYMKLLKYSISHSWLLTLLTAASPVYDVSFDGKNETMSTFDNFASMRNGERGYWNHFVPILDYSNIDNYCESIEQYVDQGDLISADELYLPVRIKSKGRNTLDKLRNDGVDHIELRMFDVNPLTNTGVCSSDLKFAYYLLLYLADEDDFEFDSELQHQAITNQKNAALYDLSDIDVDGMNILDKATEILNAMREYYEYDREATRVVEQQLEKLKPGSRYAEILYKQHIDDFQNSVLDYCVEINK